MRIGCRRFYSPVYLVCANHGRYGCGAVREL